MVMLVLHSLERVFELLAIDLLSYGYGMNILFVSLFIIFFNKKLLCTFGIS